MLKKNLAVVKINNQQYLMQDGDILMLNKVEGEVGKTIEVTDVLLKVIDEKIEVGTPIVAKSIVSLELYLNLTINKEVVNRYITAEFARQLFGENQYYQIILKDDNMIKAVMKK